MSSRRADTERAAIAAGAQRTSPRRTIGATAVYGKYPTTPNEEGYYHGYEQA